MYETCAATDGDTQVHIKHVPLRCGLYKRSRLSANYTFRRPSPLPQRWRRWQKG